MTARAALTLLLSLAAGHAPAQDARRSGYEDMTTALRAMQDDRAQNPALLWVQAGQALWRRPAGQAALSCADCHALAGAEAAVGRRAVADAAARHPAWDERMARPVTLAQRIALCRQRQQRAEPLPPEHDDLLSLEALLADAARGRVIAPPDDARLGPWRERGRRLWTQRLGQLDLACTHCHDQRAGRHLGGSVIPQGHATGYPAYRLQWQGLGGLQRRLRGCVVGVRAQPWAHDAAEWVELELHLSIRAAGMHHEGTAVRP